MKRVANKVLAGAVLLGLSQPFAAGAAEQDVLKKIEALEKQLQEMKDQLKSAEQKAQTSEKKADEAARKVEKVEEKSLGRWLTIGGDYRFRVDSLRGSVIDHASGPVFGQTYQMTGDPVAAMAAAMDRGHGYKAKNDSLMTHRFGLNMKAKATKDVSVTARLLMYKTSGAQDDDAVTSNYFADRVGAFDGTLGHVPSDGSCSLTAFMPPGAILEGSRSGSPSVGVLQPWCSHASERRSRKTRQQRYAGTACRLRF